VSGPFVISYQKIGNVSSLLCQGDMKKRTIADEKK
jgi:hypothetical protein